jgi:hypothetical protein
MPFEAIERASKRRSPVMPASAKIPLEIPDWWKNLLIVSGLVHFDDLAVSGQKSRSEYHPSATCGFSFAIAAASLLYRLR